MQIIIILLLRLKCISIGTSGTSTLERITICILRFHLSAQPFYHGLQLGMCNSHSQIGQPIVYKCRNWPANKGPGLLGMLIKDFVPIWPANCLIKSALALHLTTIISAPHHNRSVTHHNHFCNLVLHLTTDPLHCTSPQTTMQPQTLNLALVISSNSKLILWVRWGGSLVHNKLTAHPL